MSVVTASAKNEYVYDDYLNAYKDIVNLSKVLLNTSPSANTPKFCFDTGAIIHLWSIGHNVEILF